nr:unnamed protein product [Callosobruchus chinensis]
MKTTANYYHYFCMLLMSVLNFDCTDGRCHSQWPSCGSDKNVVCETDYGKPAEHCKIIEATPLFRKAIIDSHNYYRNHVAIGNETRGAFRNVADMRAMSYDSYLEFTAQCQAAKCIYDHDTACYATKNFSDVGQNLNGRVDEEGSNHTFSTVEETRKMVTDWFELEITESDEKVLKDFSRMKAAMIGYLYQMVWADTHRVGCGRSVKEDMYNMMICNYGPRGLRVTKSLGKFGPPCSRCPEKPEQLSCNTVYEGLCGEIDESHYNLTISVAVRAFDRYLSTKLTAISTYGHCYTRWPSCGSEKNIVCTTNYGQPAANCKIIYNDPAIRKAIVDTHNYYRNKVAIGNETRGAFKSIADMLAMSYDSDLEFTAQCQASRCIYDHEYEYEITESNENVFEDFSRMKTMLIGYLYQMIWAESHRIGCGRSVSEKKYHMMICNYGPRGLRVTRPLGKIGRPCTKCPEEMSCNTEYKGLCGEIDESHYFITVDGAVRLHSGAFIWVITFCFVAEAVST